MGRSGAGCALAKLKWLTLGASLMLCGLAPVGWFAVDGPVAPIRSAISRA